MKGNWKSRLSAVVELLALIAPTATYGIYTYTETLQDQMSKSSQGTFWTLVSFAIVLAIVYVAIKAKYEEYSRGYYQHLADLKVTDNPTSLLVSTTAKEEKVMGTIKYIPLLMVFSILIAVLTAFQNAISQLVLLLEIALGSIIAKTGLHCITVSLKENGLLDVDIKE